MDRSLRNTNPTTLNAARPYDAFETTMRTLRRRLGLSEAQAATKPAAGAAEWRAAVDSCSVESGDDAPPFDLDALRQQVRAENVQLSADAAAMAKILDDWRRTADDKEFAMKTRFFPSGVKIPGVKWTD